MKGMEQKTGNIVLIVGVKKHKNMNAIKQCLACAKELKKYKRIFCKNKCQREYNNYKKGRKRKEEMFKDLRGKRKNAK